MLSPPFNSKHHFISVFCLFCSYAVFPSPNPIHLFVKSLLFVVNRKHLGIFLFNSVLYYKNTMFKKKESLQMGTRRIRRSDGEYTLFFRKVSPFSNHHPADFICDEAINCKEPKTFCCSEQYYMYNKASLLMDSKLMAAILEATCPKTMKTMCSKWSLKGWKDSV